MAKNSCVIITPDLKQRYCQTDNISENDLALMFYEYLESPRTPNELTDEVLNSESFIGWYNWHFKLGNSRFLIQTPSAYQTAMKNWNNMKTYGMDEEGYLVVDTPLKNKVLEWIKQNRDYETHFVIYTNLEGKTTLKVEKPTYVGKKLSRTKSMSLEGIQIQTIEDIQKFLKETHTIHRYMGKWWISKTSDGLKKLQEYIADNVIDANKIHTINTENGIIVEFYEGLDLMYQKSKENRPLVKFYAPTMGKTTAAKTNKRLVDFDDIVREDIKKLADKLGKTVREVKTESGPEYKQLLLNVIDVWKSDPANNGKTLVISNAVLAKEKFFDNQVTIPSRDVFVERQVNRSEENRPREELVKEAEIYYDDLISKWYDKAPIDDRFVSEIESSYSDDFDYEDDIENIRPTIIVNDAEHIKHLISAATLSTNKERRAYMEDARLKITSFKKGDTIGAVELLKLFNEDNIPKQYKALANVLIPLFEKQDFHIKFTGNEDHKAAGTTFSSGTQIIKEVYINLDATKIKKEPYVTIIHELIHTLSISALNANSQLNSEVENLMGIVKDFLSKHTNEADRLKVYTVGDTTHELPFDLYGLKNSKEFFTVAFTEPSFQRLLMAIPLEKKETAWSRFLNYIVDGLKSLFNIHFSRPTNVFEALVPYIADVITKSAYLGSELTSNENIDASAWEVALNEEQLSVATKIAKEVLSMVDPYTVSDNYFTVMKNFGGYFEGGGAIIENDFPSISAEMISKLEEHIWTGSAFTEEDAIKFLQEAGYAKQQSGYTNASTFAMHSGGATGSDSYWEDAGKPYGLVKVNHYYHGKKTPRGNVPITEEQFERGKKAVYRANNTLKRKPQQYMDLLARNYIQVENADAIFAVGILKNGVVDGGTGWAVQMAIDDGKPVYVFDQIKKSWYTYINGQWSMCDTPTLTPNFAGIGTREENLREEGKQAIRNVYAKTFGGQVVEMPINEFEVGDRIYHQIRTFFGKKVAYSQNFKEDHVYLVKDKSGKWVPVDYSVSELTEEKFDPNSPWKPVSTGLGNTNDMFMRDFFAHQLKPSYPNLTQEQYDELLKGANEVVKYLDNFLGAGNYKVSSQEFPILGYTTKGGETKTVAGTMDLLVYDKKGNFYIIDMKTKRVLGDGTPDLSDKIDGYSRQQYMYKNMLETAIPELRGRIQPPLLLVSTVSYPSPKEGYTYTQDKNGVVYASYINTNGAKVTKPITQIAGYVAPRYHSFMSTKDVDNTIKEMLTVMTPEEFSLEYGTPEIIKESVTHRNKVVLNTEHSKLSAETEALYTIIPKEEVRFLGKKIASTFSYYVDMLLHDPEAKEMFTDPETEDNPFKDYDFTKMSRSELLNVSMLVDILLELIQEDLFNIENEQNIDKEDGIKAKLNAAYVNFDAVIKASYTEFIKLEGLTFNKSITKTYIPDGVDPSIINPTDPTEGEDNGREHWQLGVRNMSAMSGLSAQLRRFLSTIEEVDTDNDLVADRYGYGLSTTLDGNEIVNSLLIWLKDCNTMEEMETVLSKLTATHPWINTLLDEISNEPIRSQFFQCFRKDFTEYSIIVTVKKTDPYTGMPYWETVNRIINSVGAVDKVISEVKDAYFSRDIAIFKDGLWNSSKIESLATTIDSIQKHYKNKANWEALKKNLHNDGMFKTVKEVLESLGVMFDDTILADLIASDTDVVNFIGGKLSKVLVQAKYIVESLSKGINKESYDPFEKRSNDSVYNAYKNIATIAEPYVVNALEASTYANGKMYYSFVPPSYMGQLFNNLINTDKDSLELFLENNYAKYEWFKTSDSWNIQWLNDIENNREVLARKVQLSYEETDYVDLGERAYAMSLLKEYFYDQKNKSLAWYRIPTLSNKPSSEFIRNKRYSGDFRKELTKQLYNVFIQEVKRMQTVIDRAISSTITEADIIKNYDIAFSKNPEIKKAQQTVLDKIKNNKKVTREDLFVKDRYIFEDSGASFKFLDGFVEDIKSEDNIVGQYIIDKVFNRNNTNVKDADFIAPVKNRIGRIMESKVESAKTYFNSIGLNDSSMNFMLQGDSITKKTTPEEAMAKLTPAIEEYVWNDFVATINIVQLTTTDLAFYKDSVDFQKRFAQVHSPGLRLNKDATNIIKGNKVKVSDGYLRSLLIKDAISPSNIKENVRVALENRYNSMEEGPAKEEFKIMKDLIISQYDKINEADAQAYTSPTGYMKKMVMAGEWTPLMQEAYERIKSGNYNVNDLGVVWQPIKPFVYTQNGVDGHSSISKNIKVPSQHKNSEYLLLIADALTRGDKQDNVLNAIMDFMEETHEDKNGNYKQDGIDTIEFDSAVKVGVHGVIDINNLPASEVKAKLKLALSNPAHIFAYPVEDYAIQQSVPDHFNDHSQPMGSQIRALILSDLIGSAYTPLKSKKAYTSDEVRKVYQDLIARNVYRSWDELAEDLNLKGDRSARNIQLSELLQEEMSKDARYGADLRRAVMLDANNEFVIPLDDPIHSSRIQQVINSIVKSRINKQRTKGGPVVQASSFGLSDELNIVFQDKNGRELPTMKDFGEKRKLEGKELEIAYKKYIEDKQATVKHFECYIPLPSSVFEEYMLVDDGKGGKRILTIEEATDPTSEYFVHGLKDCLNAIGYRIPTEDTYSMVPIKIAGFVPKAAGEAVMLPKEITLLSGSDFDIDKLYIMMPEIVKAEYNEDEARDYYRRYVEPSAKLVDAIFGETEEINYKTWLKTTGDQFKVRGIKRIHYKQLDPKAEDYQEQLNKMSKQQVNNAIFDIQWGVITNEASQIKLFNPGSFDVQKKASRIVSIARDKSNNISYDELMKMSLDELDSLIPKESRNILDATTQVYFFKQNMTAGKLIGVFANANVSHVFCNMLPITVNVNFTFNGKNYNGAKWDPTESARGRFVSKNIAGYVGASVDAVKDPVFANMNVNMNTVNAALVLIRLGVDPEEIALFTSQPIIEEFSKRMDMAKEKSSYVSAYGIMRELLTEYGTQEEIDAAFTGLPKSDFNAKDLFDNIKNENKEMSLRIGVLFSDLLIHAEDMRDITYCTKFNSVTNAPGPLFTDNLYAREKVERFLRNVEDEKTMFSKQASTIISNNPILKSIYDATIGRGNIVQTISEPYWKYYGKTFTAINNKLSKMQGRPLTGEALEKVYQDYMLYCLNNLDFTSADDRAELIIKFPEYFAKTIKEFKENNPEFYEKEIKYNPFIQRIKKVVPGKFPLYTLQMEAGKLNGELSEEMKIGWANMVESENPKLRELGVSLFFYNLYRSGFRFSPKTFLHLAPVEVKYAIYNYVSYLSDNKLFELDSYQIYDFVVQYYRNHPDDLHNSDITYNNSSTGNMFKTSDVVLTSSTFYVTVQPIIKVNDELFVAKKSSCEPGTLEVEYIKVGRLGYSNDVVEYLPVGKHDAPSQIIPLIESTIKTTKLPTNQDSGLLDQMQGKKTAHSVQTEKKVEESAVNPSKPEIPSQITEEQLAKLISTLPKDFDDVVPMYKEGGILNTSMSVDEMLKTLFKHHPEFKQMFMDSGVLNKEGFNEFQATLSDMHNKIIEAIKNIC